MFKSTLKAKKISDRSIALGIPEFSATLIVVKGFCVTPSLLEGAKAPPLASIK